MVKEMAFGFPIENGSLDITSKFNWQSNNKLGTVVDALLSPDQMGYGVSKIGGRVPSIPTIDYPGSTKSNATTFTSASIVESAHGTGTAYSNVIVGSDDNIYLIPGGSAGAYYIGQWNPYTSRYKRLNTSLSTNGFAASVMHPNGNIYSLPSSGENTIGVTNIANGNTTILTGFPSTNGCIGAVIDQYGVIWAGVSVTGSGGMTFVTIDPNKNHLITNYSTIIGNNYFSNPVIAPNGLIFWFMGNQYFNYASDFVVTNPTTKKSVAYTIPLSLQNIYGGGGGTTFTFSNGVVAPDGNIYLIPSNSCPYVAYINPYTLEIKYISNFYLGALNGRFGAGALGPDGIIYAPPVTSTLGYMLCIDWQNKSVRALGSTLGGSATFNLTANNWWSGSILHKTGMYFCPNSFYSNGAMMLRLKFDTLYPNSIATMCKEVNI